MANLAYQVTNFAYQGVGLFAYQGSVDSTIDTHDGFDSNRKRDEEARAQRTQLHAMLAAAIDSSPAVALPDEAAALAAPFVERLESGAPRIDWQRLERESVIRAQLQAYAQAYERQMREFEEDEDDVALLLWH